MSHEIPVYKNLNEFHQNLPSNIRILRHDQNAIVYLIGTSHWSQESENHVSLVIRNVRPQAIVLEICPLRIHLVQPVEAELLEKYSKFNPNYERQLISQLGFSGALFYMSFLKKAAKLKEAFGVTPGGEFRRAIAEAKLLPTCKVYLGDRRIDLTIRRATNGLSLYQRVKLAKLMYGKNIDQEIPMEKDEIENYLKSGKGRANLSQIEVSLPTVYKSFISERDVILAHSLAKITDCMLQPTTEDKIDLPARIVGIVGLGHVEGIQQNFRKTSDKQVEHLMKVPPMKQLRFLKTLPNFLRKFIKL